MASPFSTKKLERQIKDGMNSFVEEVFKPKLRGKLDSLMDKMYKTMTTTRHKSKGKEPTGRFSQYGVPVDTGRLKSSIIKLPTTLRGGHIIGRIVQDASIAPYGAAVEYGHGIVRDGKYIGWVAPQSFMRSTKELYKGQIKKIIES